MARLTDRTQAGSRHTQGTQPQGPQPTPPPRSPFLPPEPRPQLPPAEPALRQRGLAALALAVLSLIAMMLIGNLQRAASVALVSFLVAVAAVALAVSSQRAARRAGTRKPRGATAGLVLGIIGLLFSGLALIGFLIFGPQIDQYSSCMHSASTNSEQQACQKQLDHAIDSKITSLGGK
jgi:multisubunit Na+/H+ antiporter MnhB subunit